MPLSLEDSKIFDMYERLFAEQGWRELVEDFKERQARLGPKILNDMKSGEKELAFCQGQNNIYNYIINLEEVLAKAKLQAAEEPLPEI